MKHQYFWILLLMPVFVFSTENDKVLCPHGVKNLTAQFGQFNRFTPCHNNYIGPTESADNETCIAECEAESDCVSSVWSVIRSECYYWSYKKCQEHSCQNCYPSTMPELCSSIEPCTPMFKQCLCVNGEAFPANEIALDCQQTSQALLEACQVPEQPVMPHDEL